MCYSLEPKTAASPSSRVGWAVAGVGQPAETRSRSVFPDQSRSRLTGAPGYYPWKTDQSYETQALQVTTPGHQIRVAVGSLNKLSTGASGYYPWPPDQSYSRFFK